jgi:hypothetical protein
LTAPIEGEFDTNQVDAPQAAVMAMIAPFSAPTRMTDL